MGRVWLMLGAVFCFLAVALGAFGAHLLNDLIDEKSMNIFDTGVQYMMYHGVGLLVVGLWSHWEKWSHCVWTGTCFAIGTLLFSGSLIALSLTGITWLGAITPAGGVLFLLGWLKFIHAVYSTRSTLI